MFVAFWKSSIILSDSMKAFEHTGGPPDEEAHSEAGTSTSMNLYKNFEDER